MKPLNTDELDLYVNFLEVLQGAEFQKISGLEENLCLHFWNQGPLLLYVDVFSNVPKLWLSEDKRSLNNARLNKPIELFLKAHFSQCQVETVVRVKDKGRVLRINFEQESFFEIRLFPGGANFSATHSGKSVYLKKPKDLNLNETEGYKPDEVRTPLVIQDESERHFKKSFSFKKESKSQEKEKNKKAVEKIDLALLKLHQDEALKFAQALESNQTLDEDQKKLFDPKKSVRENILWGYSEHKKKSSKIQRLEKRKQEILSAGINKKTDSSKKQSQKNEKVKTPFYNLNQKVTLRCGRSAKENLTLLRNSKPWHLWMHLRDYPSGHVLVEMSKGHVLTKKELSTAASFLFTHGAPKKLISSPMVKFEVIFTERRYVRTVKGASGKVLLDTFESEVFEWTSDKVHIF